MRIAIYSAKDFEIAYLEQANANGHEVLFLKEALSANTVDLCLDCQAVSIFAGDDASAPVLRELKQLGIDRIAIRAAGYDNVDLRVAKELDIRVANVPAYSPYAIAEHA